MRVFLVALVALLAAGSIGLVLPLERGEGALRPPCGA